MRVDAQLRDTFSDYRWDTERLVDASDCVVGLYRARGKIRDSATWVEQDFGVVFYLDEGKVVRELNYFSWAEALATAGIQE
jgi:ketosteroid isomerase-like protein